MAPAKFAARIKTCKTVFTVLRSRENKPHRQPLASSKFLLRHDL